MGPTPLCCTKVYMALSCFMGKYRHPPRLYKSIHVTFVFRKDMDPLIVYRLQ